MTSKGTLNFGSCTVVFASMHGMASEPAMVLKGNDSNNYQTCVAPPPNHPSLSLTLAM